MRIHHLNCGTCCPVGGRLFDGTSDAPFAKLVCHCLLIETDRGLVLVDTGFGMRDVERPGERLSAFFRALNNIQLRPQETAIAQMRALGFDPRDVRHIVITHLDFDHAGGIEDFPNAVVHVASREKEAASRRDGGGFVGRRRYRPQQWDEDVDWRLYPMGGGEGWFGFDAVRDLDGLPPEILLVPLAGHTWGHCGVAVHAPDSWLLHAADAYFYRGEVGTEDYQCPPGLRGYQRMMEVDRGARLQNQARLRRLASEHGQHVRIFCAHDAVEFDILSAAV
ncbi:MAG: MBL fold metallo-hydrolase [Sphingobium sp.]|uniref:MBL fold metallo-hydrolase n=1 Tax=Sphingobium sp. TaxID=1912891 RepID=UPI0029B6C2DD|nr:MBL fold metallo-hydrolase [Sphingobium sp.]MDX3911081.1 MBL fold metallo-hydrolase [Sphingobium sp.]